MVFHIGGIEGKGVEIFGKRLAGSSDGGAGEIVRWKAGSDSHSMESHLFCKVLFAED